MSYLLQEDGVSRIILEDGSGFLLLEDNPAPPPHAPVVPIQLLLRLRLHASWLLPFAMVLMWS